VVKGKEIQFDRGRLIGTLYCLWVRGNPTGDEAVPVKSEKLIGGKGKWINKSSIAMVAQRQFYNQRVLYETKGKPYAGKGE